MDKKDGSKRIPIGTFGSSAPPGPADHDPEPTDHRAQPSDAGVAPASGADPVEPERVSSEAPIGEIRDVGAAGGTAESPTAPERRGSRYPDTLPGRPSLGPQGPAEPLPEQAEEDEQEPRRPSVRSFPAPKPVGTSTDEHPALGGDAEPIRAPVATGGEHSIGVQSTTDATLRDSTAARAPHAEGAAPLEQPGAPMPTDDASRPANGTAARVPSSVLPTLAPPPHRSAVFVMDADVKWGIAILVAMFAIGFGGWYLTGGTYRDRRVLTPPVAAPAPGTAPSPSAVAPQPEAPATTPAPGAAKPAYAPAKNQSAGLADVPTPEDVRDALAPLQASLTACAKGRTGTARLDFTFVAKGRVAQLVVGGDFRGKPEAVCIARIARGIEVPPFKKARARVVYSIAF